MHLALVMQEELKVPYTIKIYKRTPDRRAPRELLAVHPLGKSPVITDNGQVIAESGAVIGMLLIDPRTTFFALFGRFLRTVALKLYCIDFIR